MSLSKMNRTQIVKYSIFESCKELEIVPFWKSLFESYSYGQFPKGLIYQNETLSYRKSKKKPALTCYVPAEPAEALRIVKYFVRNEIGVISIDEITEKRIEMSIALRKNNLPADTTWRDIRAPTTKQQMIVLFCFHLQEVCQLTSGQMNNLFITINVGLICETITSEDIVLKGGTIVDIRGLYYDDYGFFTERSPQASKMILSKPEHKSRQSRTAAQWPKIRQQYASYIGVK